MSDLFTNSMRSPFYLLKRLQRVCIRKHGKLLKGRLLDLGCGDSPYRKYMGCDQYVGFERDARDNVQVTGEGEMLPFRNEVFDSLASTEVLEHIYRFQQCVSEMYRVLKKDGIAYISVPMLWPMHYEPYDFFRFTLFGIKKVLEQEGFKVLSYERLGGTFIVIGTQLSLFIWGVCSQGFSFLGSKNAERIASLFVLPVNILFRMMSVFDRLDNRAAVGWSVIIRKSKE